MARITVARFTSPDQVNTITFPDLKSSVKEKHFWVKNMDPAIGGQALRFCFPGNNISNDYVELAPGGEESPNLAGLRGGEQITTDGVGGSVIVQAVIWEE